MKLGFNTKSMANNVIRSLATMLIGLLMIFVSDSALPIIIRISGAAFFLPALVSIITVYVSRKESSVIPKVLITIIDVGSMAFGVWLIADPVNFVDLFTILLGVILILFALFQVVMIVTAQKHSIVPLSLLAIPLLLVVAGIIIMTDPFDASSTTSVVFGICATLAGLSDLLISLKIGKGMKAVESQGGGAIVKR
ncbi:MAG: DUF308 domain-containing protein [Bacteroidaceae bacterium]|nr:DUF308 domain-containing protein [Bacteroidaceae bacterium]